MENKPRKPWIAGLLSLAQTGLGQVYNGEIRKALLFYSLPILIIPSAILFARTEFIRISLALYALLVCAYFIFVFVDAVRTAKRFNAQYCPNKYNKTIIYIGIYLLATILNISVATAVRSNIIKAYKIPSSGMEPTLLIGDRILVDRSKSARNPGRGNLIVIELPGDKTKDFIKRVVAVGGDTVEYRSKVLYVNGKAITETYVAHEETSLIPASQNPRDNFGTQVIPAGSYFVMGDNRDRSYDSRFWGAVSKDKIQGSVKCIYWSWDQEKSSVRWDRIGMKVL